MFARSGNYPKRSTSEQAGVESRGRMLKRIAPSKLAGISLLVSACSVLGVYAAVADVADRVFVDSVLASSAQAESTASGAATSESSLATVSDVMVLGVVGSMIGSSSAPKPADRAAP